MVWWNVEVLHCKPEQMNLESVTLQISFKRGKTLPFLILKAWKCLIMSPDSVLVFHEENSYTSYNI